MKEQTIQELTRDLLHRERINSIDKGLTDSEILDNITQCEKIVIEFALSEMQKITKPLKEEFRKGEL
jgi:small-conductance mechanosensitive channel